MNNYAGARFDDSFHCSKCDTELLSKDKEDIAQKFFIDVFLRGTKIEVVKALSEVIKAEKCPHCKWSESDAPAFSRVTLLPTSFSGSYSKQTSIFFSHSSGDVDVDIEPVIKQGAESPPPLSLYFDLDEFSPGDIAEIIGLLSELYRQEGGDKLVIEDVTLLDLSHALQEV